MEPLLANWAREDCESSEAHVVSTMTFPLKPFLRTRDIVAFGVQGVMIAGGEIL